MALPIEHTTNRWFMRVYLELRGNTRKGVAASSQRGLIPPQSRARGAADRLRASPCGDAWLSCGTLLRLWLARSRRLVPGSLTCDTIVVNRTASDIIPVDGVVEAITAILAVTLTLTELSVTE